jgi:sugar phosphate isomerase/epimerase
MKFALCNETFNKGQSFEEMCKCTSECGYDGIEIAPFTLGENVNDLSSADRKKIVQTAKDFGLDILGIHWLLLSPKGLHITTPDTTVVDFTKEYYKDLIRFCAEIGGKVMVHGSPKQRNWEPGESYSDVFKRAVDFFQSCMDAAKEYDVTVLIEPLSHLETNFINRAQDGLDLINAVGSPYFQLHLDVKAMYGGEYKDAPDVIRQFKDVVKHIHANDPNLRGPGQGKVDHTPIAQALRDIQYEGYVSVEVFDYTPDAETIAKESMAYLKEVYG